MEKRPVRFKPRHDIYLLKSVILRNPFGARYSKPIHDAIAADMNSTYQHEGNIVVEGRRVRERYQLLLRNWQIEDGGISKKSTETEDEYNEKIQLLQECTELQLEAERNRKTLDKAEKSEKSVDNSAEVIKAKIKSLLEEKEEVVTKEKLKSLLNDGNGNGAAALPMLFKSPNGEFSNSQQVEGAPFERAPSLSSYEEDSPYPSAAKRRKHNDSDELHDYFQGRDSDYKDKELRLKEKELELKERELELREKEFNWQKEQAKGSKDEKATLLALLMKYLK